MDDFLNKIKNSFLTFDGYDAVDILVTAFVIYFVLKFLKNNYALRLTKYIYVFVCISIVLTSKLLAPHMQIVPILFGNFVLVAIVSIFVLFPHDIRRGLWRLGSPRKYSGAYSAEYDCSEDELKDTITGIVRATQTMSKKHVGALLVIVPNSISTQITESGTMLNGLVSSALLESIFATKGPMHDGAVIIRGNKIVAAGCFLPLTQQQDMSKDLGTRHRAAIGVTENSNVLSIICSEETGVISVAKGGKLNQYYDGKMLTDSLEQIFGLKASDDQEIRLLSNWRCSLL